MTTKKEFMSRPKIASLPLAQREARWKQHKQSPGGRKTFLNKGKGKFVSRSNVSSKAPVSLGVVSKNNGPKMNGNEKQVVVRNREFIRDVQGAATWTLSSLVINPGNQLMFPWLSGVARNYESYRFKKLVFCYEPSCPTSTAGSVQMVAEFNVSDYPPNSKLEMMSYANAVRGSVWQKFSYNPKHSDFNRRKSYYVDDLPETQSLPLSGGNQENLDDVGVLLYAVVGSDPEILIGELYVDYVIELLTPQFDTNQPGQKLVTSASHTGVALDLLVNDPPGDDYLYPIAYNEMAAKIPGTYLITINCEATTGITPNGSEVWLDAGTSSATIFAQHMGVDSGTDDAVGYAAVTFSAGSSIKLVDANFTAWGFDVVTVTQVKMRVAPYNPLLVG